MQAQASATPGFRITVSPATLSLTASQSGTVIVSITPENAASLTAPMFVTISCSGLPDQATCIFTPENVEILPGATAAVTSSMVIETQAASQSTSSLVRSNSVSWAILFPGALGLLGLAWGGRRREWLRRLSLVALVGLVTMYSQGGVIPQASVVAVDQATALRQTTTTSTEGNFIFPEVPPGTYTITVEVKGFKKSESRDVVVSVATKVGVGDIVLEVGNTTETVTIEANAATIQIQADSGERSDVLTNRDIRNIALNGENIVDMMKFIPGVNVSALVANAASTVTNITGSFQVNGTRSLEHEYTIDGITNVNLGNNTGALVSINPDALEEVKVLTSNYQAEYGRAGGGVIALTTRGGTNEFHGGARYFRRHDSMNANTYFNDERGGQGPSYSRPLYRYNFYGWDFGGPVWIPKVYDGRNKLFFFVSQEYYRQLVPQTTSQNILVPTPAERTGDFSHSVDGSGKPITIIDPTTGSAFPGNMIPSSRIYAPGTAILNFLPQPNTTAGGFGYNYSSQVPSSYPRMETILRGDWAINDNARLSVRWVYNHDDQQFAYGTTTASWNWPLTITDRKNGPGSVPSISLTKNFGPTVVNETVFGIGRGGVTIAPEGDAISRAKSGIDTPLLYPAANTPGYIPSLTFGGIASVSSAASTSLFGPFNQRFLIWQVMDNLIKVHGSHVFKFGFYFQSASNASNSQAHVQSDLDFTTSGSNPLTTGDPFANALLGVYNSYTQWSAKVYQNYLYHDMSWYAQDTWKVNPRLTLDLGIRFSWYQPVYDTGGDAAYFDPSAYDPTKAARLYRPVCVGALTCSLGAATYRAIDPDTTGPATMAKHPARLLRGQAGAERRQRHRRDGVGELGLPEGRRYHAEDSATAPCRLCV